MLSPLNITQLACRASNLAERLIILKQLSEFKGSMALTPADLQAVHQDLETLFPPTILASHSQSTFYRIKRQSIQKALRHYRWVEKNLTELSPDQCQVLKNVHAPWLSTYQKAIALVGADQLPHDFANNPKMGCLPFLNFIAAETASILEMLAPPGVNLQIQPDLVASVQHCFWQRVQTMVSSSFTQFLNQEQTPYQTPPQALSIPETLHNFYLQFPVLVRWLAQISQELIDLCRQVIIHLIQDRAEISQQFWNGVAITRLINCRFISSKTWEEHPTLQLELELANGVTTRLNYYPFSLNAEVGLQKLYAVLANPQTNIPPIPIISKQGYGYIAYTQSTSERSIIEQLQGMGRHLAIRQLFGNHRGLWGKLQLGIAQEGESLTFPTLGTDDSTVKTAIQDGFNAVDGWFRSQPHQAIHALNLYFSGSTARLCHRPIETYLQLLIQAQQPDALANPLSVDAIFRTLMDNPCPWDSLGELVQLEVKMLWQFKVLWLTVPMNHRYLLYEVEHALFTKLPLSPLEYLARRVHHSAGRHASGSLNRNGLGGYSDKSLKRNPCEKLF